MADSGRMLVTLTVPELRSLMAEAVRTALAEQRPPAEPALIDRDELATALSVSPSTLDRMRSEANFPELRVGDAPRFELEAVLEWLRGRRKSLRVVKG